MRVRPRSWKEALDDTRPALAGALDEVFSPEAIVGELGPVLDETLAALAAGG